MMTKNYLIHMKSIVLLDLYENLPAKYDCGLEKNIHNLTVDADGSVRLCLRIRGIQTPTMNLLEYVDDKGEMRPLLESHISQDKNKYCEGCNWTCVMMSKYISEHPEEFDDLNHTEKRVSYRNK